MFSGIDFLSGEVRWLDDYFQEDMLLVRYPNQYILDVGWYGGIESFLIYIIKDEEWRDPVVKYIVKDKNKLHEVVLQAVERIERESKKGRAYYGGLWKTEVIEVI